MATARPTTVARIVACPAVPADGSMTTAWWTRKYILALRAEGYSDARIATWIGTSPARACRVSRVRVKTARLAEAVYRSITGEARSTYIGVSVGYKTRAGAR